MVDINFKRQTRKVSNKIINNLSIYIIFRAQILLIQNQVIDEEEETKESTNQTNSLNIQDFCIDDPNFTSKTSFDRSFEDDEK